MSSVTGFKLLGLRASIALYQEKKKNTLFLEFARFVKAKQ